MTRLLAMYLAHKWATAKADNCKVDSMFYDIRNDVFKQEYLWMYNILNPKL